MKHCFYTKAGLLVLAFAALFVSCRPEKEEVNAAAEAAQTTTIKENFISIPILYNANVPVQWNELFLKISRYAPGYRPPASARALAYCGLAAWESARPGNAKNKSLASNVYNIPMPDMVSGSRFHAPTAVATAYYTCFKYFFPHIKPELKAEIETLYQSHINQAKLFFVSESAITTSKTFGANVADAIIAWEKTDLAGKDAYLTPQPTDFTMPTGAFLWKPTLPDLSLCLFPRWGKVRTFAITEAEKTGLPPSVYVGSLGSTTFMNQTKEVYNRCNNAKNGTNYDDKWIAEFWSDDVFELTFEPAARIIAIGNQCIWQRGANFWTAVELYAKLGLALNDDAVAIWNTKYTYNTERPVSTINRLIDPNWRPLLNNPLKGTKGITPPFPGYPSGHSGFGGVSEIISKNMFGDFGFVDLSHLGRTEFMGTPRSYSSFKQMAEENAYSRIPLGVHIKMDCDEGLRIGRMAAAKVLTLPWH